MAKKLGAVVDAIFAGSYHGGTVATSVSGTLPTPTQLRLGSEGTNYLNGWLASVTFYDTAATTAELPGLTSPTLIVAGAQTTQEATTTGTISTVAADPPLTVTGDQTTPACITAGTIGEPVVIEEHPVAPGGPSRAAQRRLKQAIENRSRFEAERAKRLANLTNDRPLFVTPPETLEMINEVLVEEIDHSILFEDEADGEELLLLLWAA